MALKIGNISKDTRLGKEIGYEGVGRPPADIAGALKPLRAKREQGNWHQLTPATDAANLGQTVAAWKANLFTASRENPDLVNYELATRTVERVEGEGGVVKLRAIVGRYVPPTAE